ncbi:TetR/AcrR family transcriptional regulator [Rhodococcus kronopolitis]|uniref:TetR/AcrR family transcriptional regulator n=1 Tax=Rhodococcus kronopolitis TaxID=1460226 RepID=A0ABV9FU62_9NOCA
MPRINAPTVAEHRAAQRRALLDAAREVLAEGSADDLGFAEVATRAGLARSSVYQYFKSRRDLIDALIEDSFPRWSERVQREMDAAGGPDRRVLAYVRANLDLVAEGEHAAASSLAALAPTARTTAESASLHRQLSTPLIAALTELGAVDAAATAELVNAVVHAATRQVEAGDDIAAVQARAAELIEPYVTLAATSGVRGNITP